MIITTLQAQIAPENIPTLQRIYTEQIASLDAGIVETFLVQSITDPQTWQIITVWESREALDAMRASGVPPRGIMMFRAAGAEPTLGLLKVEAHARRG